MTEARLVTREQLALAIPSFVMELMESMAGWERQEIADAMWKLLPAAAPADEGPLHHHPSGPDGENARECRTLHAAPAEGESASAGNRSGLREALIAALEAECGGWPSRGRECIGAPWHAQAFAALARHESGSE